MEITNVMEYETLAKEKLPKMIYDYYASGAEDQWTLNENRYAFSRTLFRPRILVDVSKIDMTTTVLGFNISMPIMVAPTAMQKMAHPDGEYATARASAAAGTIMTLSSWSTSSVEEVASTGPGVRFFQLYVYKDRNGFKAIVLTVDTPFVLPPNFSLKNFDELNPGKLDKTDDPGLASYFAGYAVAQDNNLITYISEGFLTAEDARIAVQYGVAGIIVSNHGARQLDYVPATVMALEEVVKATQNKVPVFLDGGIRRGTDILKHWLLIGRPVVFALAVDGEAGVRKTLQMLHDELELTMALSGCCSLAEITRNHIVAPWDPPRVTPRL
ncbi:hypothetical protein M8C21_016838 [Ambrosia artemisiifolia]|uniref:(S)-2-hydroxy-acid oxidase n=1 Tax=Ambrosia artemisiifolia TaxID=4212 RepID=A0AAD5GL42_AMBAR|nr:hypothetical protein M8C21_016838 [Ambrosia artemisiifolia]